jgi:hypothetical protein
MPLQLKSDYNEWWDFLPSERTGTAFNGGVTSVAPDTLGPLTIDEWGQISHAPINETRRPLYASSDTPRSPDNIPFWQRFFGGSGATMDIGPWLEDTGGNQVPPIDAGILRNPSLENFGAVQWGNTLNANYADDTAASLSLQDPTGWITNPVGQSISTGLGLETGGEGGDSILRLPGVFDLNKTTLKETGVFIVGAIILGIGILALTR